MNKRLVAALTAALVIVPAGAAQAKASLSQAQTAAPDGAARAGHCVIDLSSSSREAKCFRSLRAAVMSATGGRVTDTPNDVKTAMASTHLARELNAASGRAGRLAVSYVLGIEYQHANWQGATLTFTGNAPCTTTINDVDYSVPSIGYLGWNDVISSFRSFSNCWTKDYEHDNFGGASVGFVGSLSYIGDAMNDRTSSVQFS